MNPLTETCLQMTRRRLFGTGIHAAGTAALASLLGAANTKPARADERVRHGGLPDLPHHPPTAKRFIYLFMNGGPAQMDMYDYKPMMNDLFDKDLPDTIRKGQRITTMTSGQARFPIAPSMFKFQQHGQCGRWVSELLPETTHVVDDMSFIYSVHTNAINHDPAVTYIQTGRELPGWPSMGSWLAYGLGAETQDLPNYVVMTPSWTGRKSAQALYSRLWGSGFLPPDLQGVALRAKGDPVLYINNPPGLSSDGRRKMLDGLAQLNQMQLEKLGDPETAARMSQYEMAFRMQTSVPELTDLSQEPKHVLDLYGPDVTTPGTFAASCLLARRLSERGVQCIQLFHRGWDQHANLPNDLRNQCRDIDRATRGLIEDLKQRDMLKDTVILWGGEFGRTVYCQGDLSRENYGRDHHPLCFTMWMAGGGIQGGRSIGVTDDFSYNVIQDPVGIADINNTILHCLGIDNKRMSVKFQGLDARVTGVEEYRLLNELLT
ncbi:MAG: DUF1501 domain-containing protein [Planctomycetaceae bacterium]|nr:DUF1501 domain-containing protein [Planctomycetaceae bacterium]